MPNGYRRFVERFYEKERRELDPKKVNAEIRRVKEEIRRDPNYSRWTPEQKEAAVAITLYDRLEENPGGYKRRVGKSPTLRPESKLWALKPWRWHPIRGLQRLYHHSQDFFKKAHEKETIDKLYKVIQDRGDILPEDVKEKAEDLAKLETYKEMVDILAEDKLMPRRQFKTVSHDLEIRAKKKADNLVDILKKESSVAIILLIATLFTLFSMTKNPTITGKVVLEGSVVGNNLFGMGIILFLIVIILIYLKEK